jgi:hypothetical protein
MKSAAQAALFLIQDSIETDYLQPPSPTAHKD